ncbi:MAG: hypothetical protein SNH18_07660 [Rikenellaceae bacterium]
MLPRGLSTHSLIYALAISYHLYDIDTLAYFGDINKPTTYIPPQRYKISLARAPAG